MNNNRTTNSYKTRRGGLCALFLLITCIPFGHAQETDKGDVFELSPFVVSTDSEVGYLATQTLSGTRMRSDLSDVAASVDVLTEELLRDVAAVDMYDALDLVGSVSTWGKSGGISEAENQVWFSNPYMARGFITSAVTSDFFNLGKPPLDFYNRTNITVARGPNAILYGIGSPGGIVNSSRKRPQFGKDLAELQLRTDEYGSFRTTLDFSREIIDNKLAVRAVVLHDDRKEFLKPAGYLREAIYGAVTYQPFEKSTLTITAESGKEDRTFRYTTTQYDGITPWINAGKPIYSGYKNNPPINQALGSGLDREAKIALQISGQPEIPILDWQNMARTERFELPMPPYPSTFINEIRATGYTGDTAIWDYDEIQMTGNSRQRELDWTDYAVFFTQELFPGLDVELAYNRTETEYMLAHSFGQFFLQMDVNEKLPNGASNPNFMVPYVESARTETVGEINVSDTARATLSYELDLNDTEIFGIGLGRYNFMGLYENNRVNSLFAGWRRGYIQNIAGFPVNDIGNAQNYVRTRTYVDTYLTPEGANVQPYFTNDWSLIDRDGASDGWYRNTSPRDINDERNSYVLAVQAFLWQARQGFDRIILTAGYRNDRQTSQRKGYTVVKGVYEPEAALWRGDPFNMDAEAYAAAWDGTYNYGTWGEKTLTEEPTQTYSAIFKLTKDISLFYNYSDVMISASSLFTDIYDRPVGPTIGETEDFGVRLDLLDGRLVASFTAFTTSAVNQTESDVRTRYTPELVDIWAVVDPNNQIHKGFNERYVTLRNDTSEGFEFSLTANLTRGWSTRLSVSNIETIIQSRLPIVSQYIAEFSPLWEAKRNEDLLPSDQVQPNYLTVGDALDSLYTEIANLQALVGTQPNAQRDWKVVLNTSYNFRDGALKGWGVGGGFRWESSDIIGYGFDQESLDNPNVPVVRDASKPYDGDELLDVNGWLSYTTTIKGVWMRFQLNVSNLLDDRGTFARSAVDDLTGNPWYGRQQVKEPRSFVFTTTFKF